MDGTLAPPRLALLAPVRWRVVVAGLALLLGILIPTLVLAISGYTAGSLSQAKRAVVAPEPAALGMRFESVTFPSRVDGIDLRGWLLPAEPPVHATIIMVHGKDGQRADGEIRMLYLARDLVSRGYDVLTFDLRGHGLSDGTRFSLGYFETRDLGGALDYLRESRQVAGPIGVIGFSMGAATALLTAADEPALAAVVADSSFADLRELLDVELPKASGLPGFFTPPTLLMGRLLYGMDLDSVKPERRVAAIAPRPLLIIHGAADSLIPVDQARRIHSAARSPYSELWIVEGVEHARAYAKHPQEYVERVVRFLGESLR